MGAPAPAVPPRRGERKTLPREGSKAAQRHLPGVCEGLAGRDGFIRH